ncbi:choline monooxygenase [Fusarium heterosporum]|uniref:Choline monooxygenase n=1 Tax=Fusarium heterosporum TaxID=42747 RepID=A0A8H5SRM2_FUSHE|nr:choline monooxygenase [Fusarium heterosporum]
MTSLILFGALLALAASSFSNIWLFANRKARTAGAIEDQTANPISLPKGWWSNAERFQAERRAIFSQTWMCVSHRGRFKTPGDYIVYEVAGFRFFMILGKDKVVRSFHNVCRHRAFPVARKDSGSSTILGCRYHGWSYDYTGRLIKAPYFDNKPGFDKSMNSLFGISTKEDKNGFLYINPGTDNKIAKSILQQGITTGSLIKITPDTSQLHSFQLNGTFNWKLIGKLDIFPLTVVHTASGSNYWYQITYNPISATNTSVRCDVYSTRGFESPQLDEIVKDNLEKEIKQRVQDLEAEHKKVTTFGYDGVSTSHYQGKIASVVDNHIKQERLRGCDIRPAEVKAQANDRITAKAESLCAAVECGDKKLDW